MSIATIESGSPSVSSSGSWVSLAEASRLLGRHGGTVKSMALAPGGIRTRAVPGARILYNRSDCERLASGEDTADEQPTLPPIQG
jgi:hypothetical protein